MTRSQAGEIQTVFTRVMRRLADQEEGSAALSDLVT